MVKTAAIPWIYSIPHADVLVSSQLEGINQDKKLFAIASVISLLAKGIGCIEDNKMFTSMKTIQAGDF